MDGGFGGFELIVCQDKLIMPFSILAIVNQIYYDIYDYH